MTKKIIVPAVGVKDEHGAYTKPVVDKVDLKPEKGDVMEIDALMVRGLLALSRLTDTLLKDITANTFDRDTIMNLKDAMAMLRDLKKEERELLENMSDEELQKKLNS